jgi:5-(carboxyamino)imidazole ribonucleotide synthase
MKAQPCLPGQTWIGVLGGGQLGRMLTMEARRMGYRVITWTGGGDPGPAGLADLVLDASFDCGEARAAFLSRATVATVEFENIPARLLNDIAEQVPLTPGPDAVTICQHREREKSFLSRHGFPCAWHQVIDGADGLAAALKQLPSSRGILKTAEFGYDGKGQLQVTADGDPVQLWNDFGADRAVLEERIDLAAELSVIVVRNRLGEIRCYAPALNEHRHHILDWSLVPSGLPPELVVRAEELAREIASALEFHGVLAVEYFLARDGRLLVNELAPRPHNSGHHTLDACETSQFEQQLRAVCNLPAGGTGTVCPVLMSNLLGDVWPPDGAEPDWLPLLRTPGARLHLYGKAEARPGRKMGHMTFLAQTRNEVIAHATRVRQSLSLPPVQVSV